MKMYAVLKEEYLSSDGYVNEILDNKCFSDCVNAYEKMLEDAQYTVDDWNQSPPGEFKLEVFPKIKSCSVSGEYESDYVNYSIIEMEVM